MAFLNKACFVTGSAVLVIAIGGGLEVGNQGSTTPEDDYLIDAGGGSNSSSSSSGSGSGAGTGYSYPPGVDPSTLPPGNGDINQSAQNMIGVSTAGIPGTDGGNLGCAAAVSMMFKNATGQQLVPGQDITLGTGELYNSLRGDGRFVQVSFADARPGDIVVTARGSQAGHTGIVTDGGRIISNSSGGFNGSAPGTIQNNYSIDGWSSVTARNPDQTGVFRYVGG